jgi:hypothetical protein
MSMRSKEALRINNQYARLAMPMEACSARSAPPRPTAPSLVASPLIDPADLQLLAEIGLSAAARGLGAQAEPIFEALALLHPDNAAAAIGRALSALARRDADSAIEILKRDGVRARICGAEARALLAIALNMAGRSAEARAVCRGLADGRDGPAKKVALGLLKAEMADA